MHTSLLVLAAVLMGIPCFLFMCFLRILFADFARITPHAGDGSEDLIEGYGDLQDDPGIRPYDPRLN